MPYAEITDMYYSNADYSLDTVLHPFFDYIDSGKFVFRNVTLHNLCGQASCDSSLFSSNRRGVFEFYNLTVYGFNS